MGSFFPMLHEHTFLDASGRFLPALLTDQMQSNQLDMPESYFKSNKSKTLDLK
jgi:hypothetical protein